MRRLRPRPYSIRYLTAIPEQQEMTTVNDISAPQALQSQQPSQSSQAYETLKIPDAVKDLPTFNGNPRQLNDFLENVEEILRILANIDGSNQATVVLRAIRNKIVGEANEVLNSSGTPLVWEVIKANLILKYSDKRSETSLVRELHNLRQTNQTVQEFYGSVIELQAAINNNISIHETNKHVINSRREFNAKMCLDAFLIGLREPLGSMIRSMRPDSLDEALTFCIQEQNIQYSRRLTYNQPFYQPRYRQNTRNYAPARNYQPNMNNTHRFTHGQIHHYAQNNINRFQNTVNTQGRNQYNPITNAFSQKGPQAPNGNTFSHNGSGQSKFSNFRQQQLTTKPLPPPEPMDVSSGYSHLRKPMTTQTRQTSYLNNVNVSQAYHNDLDGYYHGQTHDNDFEQNYTYHQNDDNDMNDLKDQQNNGIRTEYENVIVDNENFHMNAYPHQRDT